MAGNVKVSKKVNYNYRSFSKVANYFSDLFPLYTQNILIMCPAYKKYIDKYLMAILINLILRFILEKYMTDIFKNFPALHCFLYLVLSNREF